MPEWLKGTGCKPVGVSLRWFESSPAQCSFWGLSAVQTGGFYYDIRSPSPVFYGPCYFNGQPTTLEELNLPVRGMGIFLEGYNDGIITDALPDENTFPDLSVFTETARFGSGGDGSLGFGVGQIYILPWTKL